MKRFMMLLLSGKLDDNNNFIPHFYFLSNSPCISAKQDNVSLTEVMVLPYERLCSFFKGLLILFQRRHSL